MLLRGEKEKKREELNEGLHRVALARGCRVIGGFKKTTAFLGLLKYKVSAN